MSVSFAAVVLLQEVDIWALAVSLYYLFTAKCAAACVVSHRS
jgi:hypothetical protein